MNIELELQEVLLGASVEFFSYQENPIEADDVSPYKDGYKEIRIVGKNTNPYFGNGLWRIFLVHTLPECAECDAFWDGHYYLLPVPEGTIIDTVSCGKKIEGDSKDLYAHIVLKDSAGNLYTYDTTLPEDVISEEEGMTTIH